MLSLVETLPGSRIRIFSGIEPGCVKHALLLAAEGEDGVERTPCGCGGGSGGLGTILAAARSSGMAVDDAIGN